MRARGFTMIELLVTLAIVGLILTLAAPRYFSNIDRAREDVLREDLYILRDAIDKFYADRNVYPAELTDLVKEKYLRAIPVDPITNSAAGWILVPPEDATLGKVANVRSGAANKGRNGIPYAEW